MCMCECVSAFVCVMCVYLWYPVHVCINLYVVKMVSAHVFQCVSVLVCLCVSVGQFVCMLSVCLCYLHACMCQCVCVCAFACFLNVYPVHVY